MVRVVLIAALTGSVLGAQWLSGTPALPHAPLRDCAGHHCGCPTEMTARRACCCVPDTSNAVLKLRPARCDSGGSPSSAPAQKLHWTVVAPEQLNRPVRVVWCREPVAVALIPRAVRPPVPPPKCFPCRWI